MGQIANVSGIVNGPQPSSEDKIRRKAYRLIGWQQRRCYVANAICSHSINFNIRSELSSTASDTVWEPEPLWKQLEQLVPLSLDKLWFWRPGRWFNQQFICQQQPSPSPRRTRDIYNRSSPAPVALVGHHWHPVCSSWIHNGNGNFIGISNRLLPLTRWRVKRGNESLPQLFGFHGAVASACHIPFSNLFITLLLLCTPHLIFLSLSLSLSPPALRREQSNSHCLDAEGSAKPKALANISYLYFAPGPEQVRRLAGEAEILLFFTAKS